MATGAMAKAEIARSAKLPRVLSATAGAVPSFTTVKLPDRTLEVALGEIRP